MTLATLDHVSSLFLLFEVAFFELFFASLVVEPATLSTRLSLKEIIRYTLLVKGAEGGLRSIVLLVKNGGRQ